MRIFLVGTGQRPRKRKKAGAPDLHRVRSGGGFTLLEVLVAFAIMAVVLTATYATFSAITGQIRGAREDAQVFQEARLIIDRMFTDFTCAVSLVSHARRGPISPGAVTQPFLCTPGIQQEVSFQRVSFSSTAHLAMTARTSGWDLTRIEYRMTYDPERDRWILSRSDDPFPGGSKARDRFIVLGEDIGRFELIMYDRSGRPHRMWDSSKGPLRGELPRRITIHFTLKGIDGKEYPFRCGWTLPPSLF